MEPIRADPSPAPRLQNWVRAEQVIDGATVDVGFDDHHPKEPAAVHHDGTTYVACAVWNEYAFPPTRKEVVLCGAPEPDGEFVQYSRVTDSDHTNHAPAVAVADGDLWVLYSRTGPDSRGNDIRGRRAPIDDIPATPAGWTDEGVLFEDARDPGVARDADGRVCVVAKDERGDGVVGVDGPSLRELPASRARTVYTNTFGEAPDIVPKATEGFWLVTAEQVGEGPRLSVAGEADTPLGEFRGYYALGTHRSLGPVAEPFHAEWTLHHDYLHAADGRRLHRTGGEVAAFFEAGDGERFGVGVGFLDDGG